MSFRKSRDIFAQLWLGASVHATSDVLRRQNALKLSRGRCAVAFRPLSFEQHKKSKNRCFAHAVSIVHKPI
jgi:hypothetical protein